MHVLSCLFYFRCGLVYFWKWLGACVAWVGLILVWCGLFSKWFGACFAWSGLLLVWSGLFVGRFGACLVLPGLRSRYGLVYFRNGLVDVLHGVVYF